MKVGDLVKLPDDDCFWWGSKCGLVVGFVEPSRNPHHPSIVVKVLVDGTDTRFGIRFLEVLNESR